jgi:hypothetical protein
MAGDEGPLRTKTVNQLAHATGESVGVVSRNARRAARQVVAPHVSCHNTEPDSCQGLSLVPTAVPKLGATVKQDQQRAFPLLDIVDPHLV